MEKDYTKYSFRITLIVVVLLLGISFIPPFTMGGIKFRRANIISDIYNFGDVAEAGDAAINADDQAFIEEMERLLDGESVMNAGEIPADPVAAVWELGIGGAESDGDEGRAITTSQEDAERFAKVVQFEDFSETGDALASFASLLGSATQKRVVRIAFLGDSYIEGDILTADVRAQLQTAYGGRGVGFVPFSTPLAQFRPTVKLTYGGWKNYNLIQKKSAAEDVKDRFYVSGIVSVPQGAQAWSRFETTSFRPNLASVSSARLFFTNTASSEITMIVNDTIERKFCPVADEQVQQINVSGSGIKSVKISVDKPEGFYGYGVVLESGRGVSVDNYSIRSNSGLALFGTSGEVNRRINRMLGYDMVVLQYGLNIMSADVTGYKSYGEQLRNVINYIKGCFPGAVVVVMGVGDRSTQVNGEFVTMPAVNGMIKEQRSAASDSGVVFWNTYQAMGGYNSMARFVEWGWAAKDYTHLSFGGGRKIATEFVNALEYARIYGGVAPGDYTDESPVTLWQPAERIDSFEANDSDTVQSVGRPTSAITADSLGVDSIPATIQADSVPDPATGAVVGEVTDPDVAVKDSMDTGAGVSMPVINEITDPGSEEADTE